MEIRPDEIEVKSSHFSSVDEIVDIKILIAKEMLKQNFTSPSVKEELLNHPSIINEFKSSIVSRQPSITFRHSSISTFEPESHLSLFDKIKLLLHWANKKERLDELRLENIKTRRNDLPHLIDFTFTPYEYSGKEGYKIEVISEPFALLKSNTNVLENGVDKEKIVHTNKKTIRRIMNSVGAQALREPYTESELIDSVIHDGEREVIERLPYGKYILLYSDEGDKCMKYSLYHSALSCYIHAIEWCIISYLKSEDELDVIEQEMEESNYYNFHNLVEELQEHSASVSQKTLDKMEEMNKSERRWIAHHKTGTITSDDVQGVKNILQKLIDDIILP